MPQLSYCAEQVRRFDNDRFLCTLFAPPAEREALSALYAFNLEIARVRESVREPMLGRIRLQWWRDAIEGICSGVPQREPVAEALAAAIDRFGLGREHFDRLIEAREFDLADRPPATLDDLVRYAEGTGAPLVKLSAEVLGARGAAPMAAAEDLGAAWALTGLIRAVPFHARARRLYLPAALSRRAGLDVLAMFERGSTPGVPAVIEAVAGQARERLTAARAARRDVPARALPAFMPATLAALYLKRIAAAGYDPFDARVQAGGAGRLLALAVSRLRKRY
ncbi:MAG: squalene/phytoene synthase family protein [Rhodospirillales bacterium]|nr:squalene/phytoene synthase family protein [Rhodospirillales bacterium]